VFPTGQTSIFSGINLVSVQALSIKAPLTSMAFRNRPQSEIFAQHSIVLQAVRFHRPGLEARELVNELRKPD
jgi:hypothetical protein